MNNKINKKYYKQTIYLIHCLPNQTLNEYQMNFDKNLKSFFNKLIKTKPIINILFVLNNFNQPCILNFLNDLILNYPEINIFGLSIFKNKYKLINLNVGYETEINHSNLIIKYNKKNELDQKEIQFDLIFLGIDLFNEQKKCCNQNTSLIKYIFNKLMSNTTFLIGYSYSLNKFHFNDDQDDFFDLNYLITNNYIL